MLASNIELVQLSTFVLWRQILYFNLLIGLN